MFIRSTMNPENRVPVNGKPCKVAGYSRPCIVAKHGVWRYVADAETGFILAHDGSQADAIKRAGAQCAANPGKAEEIIARFANR